MRRSLQEARSCAPAALSCQWPCVCHPWLWARPWARAEHTLRLLSGAQGLAQPAIAAAEPAVKQAYSFLSTTDPAVLAGGCREAGAWAGWQLGGGRFQGHGRGRRHTGGRLPRGRNASPRWLLAPVGRARHAGSSCSQQPGALGLLAEYALGLVGVAYILPPLARAGLEAARGYAGAGWGSAGGGGACRARALMPCLHAACRPETLLPSSPGAPTACPHAPGRPRLPVHACRRHAAHGRAGRAGVSGQQRAGGHPLRRRQGGGGGARPGRPE